MNREIVTAVVTIKSAGREIDLADKIAEAWQAERERKLNRTIGEAAGLAIDLQRILKISRQQADEAADKYLNRSYSDVAIETTLQFAKEILPPAAKSQSPRSAIRQVDEERGRLNPTNGEPSTVPPAIRRATAHAIQHRVKARAGR